MGGRSAALAFFIALAAAVLLPVDAYAQSAIAGVVKDTSGAVLPGATVEASSSSLIEKARAVVTDGSGQYKIVDLRPGTYAVTFTLIGFQTLRREGVELPSEFTATINAELRVGAVEETVTVSGAAPTVDVQSAAHVQVLDREAIDNIPTGRTIQSIGQIVVGINLSLPDVGGSRAAMQTYMTVHGLSAANNTVMIDGLMVNGLELNGTVQGYFNDAMSQEMSYQTSGIGADVSSGGVRVNMIPKEGGNRFSGSSGLAYRPGRWQGDNLTPRLQSAGLTAGNSTEYISDFTVAEGGPIVKDKIWFFTTGRDYRTSNRISNTFFADGKQGDDYNYIRDGLARVTWQASARHKFAAYYDRVSKYRAHDMQSLYDPQTASNVWTSPNYSTGSIKWTSTLTNKLLIEAGYAFNIERRDVDMQPGVEKDRGTLAWIAGASRTQAGVALGARTTAPSTAGQEYPTRYSYNVAASYVTGSHHVKFGLNGTRGDFYHATRANGDLTEQFANADTSAFLANGGPIVFGNPVSVVIRNTPVQSEERLNRDIGVFGMDTWTLKRLTVNAGLRWEYLNSQVVGQTVPAGRFVPARTAPDNLNLPNWKDFAPRFQVVYDVSGKGKTAVKFSLNRYNQAQTTTLAAGFNPLGSKTSNPIAWTDLNGDGVAQGQRTWNADGTFTNCVYLTPGCEINLAQLPANFGLLSDAGAYGGYPRTWNLESGLEVQHELMPRISVSGAWFYGNFHNLASTVNRNLSAADYTPVQVFNPLDGSPITIYNISAAAQGRAIDNFTFVDPSRRDVFNSYEFQLRARPGHGALIFGGVSLERNRTKNCAAGQSDPNLLRFCDSFSLPSGQEIPYAANWRLNASYPLPWWGVTVSGAFQSNDGGARSMSYTILHTTRYPDGSPAYLAAGAPVAACPAPCTAAALVAPNLTLATFGSTTVGSTTYSLLPLVPTGSIRYERLNQLDLKVSKSFKARGVTVAPTLEVFNVNNSDKVITVASTSYAVSGGAYLRPNSIVQGRIVGIGLQTRW